MAHIINLTPQPFTVTSAQSQGLWEAADVLNYDALDLELGVVGTAGSQTSSVVVQLINGMQTDVDDGSWTATATNFASIANPGTFPSWQLINLNQGFLRFVRWKVATLGGFSAVSFSIRGMARKF